MIGRSLLHRLEYLAYRAVAGLTQRLSQSAVRRWGRGVGRLAHLVLRRRRRMALDNLARALPELDAAGRERIARLCFEWQGVIHHEQVWAMGRSDEIVARCEIVGLEHLESARARGKGLFVLTGHYGCWEIAGYPLGRLLGKLHIVARPQNNQLIATAFEQVREHNGNVQIDRGRAGFRMLKVLKQGGAIGIAIDQRVRPSHGLLVPFLGRYAWTSRLPAFLSTVTGCAAVPMVCVPLPEGGYRMTLDPPIYPESAGEDEIERLTRRYNEALEPYVRAQPELWLWLHSRWQRTTPHRRPDAIERIVREAELPARVSLRDVARHTAAGSPARRLDRLVTSAFLEEARHLLLETAPHAGAPRREGTAEAQAAPGTTVAAAIGGAFARLGQVTRYFESGALIDQLEREREKGRLDAAMRDLDLVAFVVVADADPRRFAASQLELFARFLEHRLERGSLALVGADASAWHHAARTAGELGGAIEAFVAVCERIPFDTADLAAFADAAPSPEPATFTPESEPEARAPAV